MNLANHLWQSTLFAAVAGMLTLALRNNHARVRHAIWLAASVKFLIPLSILMALGGQIHWRQAPAAAAQPAIAVVMDQVSRPFTVLPTPASVPTVSHLPAVLFAVWAGGVLALIFTWWVRWCRIRAVVRLSSPMPLEIPIRAVSSPATMEPGVFGVFRPVLVLPEAILERLTPEQMEAVLAHELCHVRHRDNLVAALHMAVETAFWFHPLVWWIGKRMVAERERACDEEVLRLGSEPRVYAEGILNVCKICVESPLACVSGVTGADLKKRIAAIMRKRAGVNLKFPQKLTLAVAGFVALAAPILIGIMHAPAVRAQNAAAPKERPTFEVASIKPAAGGPGMSFGVDRAGNFNTKNINLLGLIANAYGVQQFQVYDAPAWTRSEAYDIVAKREVERAEGPPKPEALQAMMADIRLRLQSLLEDRFQLRVHRETKELPVLALVFAKGGSKLQPSDCLVVDPQNPPPRPQPGEQPKFCGNLMGHNDGPNSVLNGYGNDMAGFTRWLAGQTGRTVIDRTGYTEKFNLTLQWLPDRLSGSAGVDGAGENPPPDANGPSLFTALQEQLGLKLENSKGPVEVVVVDRVERPTGN